MSGKQNAAGFKEKLLDFLKGDKKVKVIVFIGVLGIVLILLSDIIAPKQEKKAAGTDSNSTFTESNQVIEQQIYDMVTAIEGVGKAKVMVTLESSAEYVYAKEEKSNTDVTRDAQDGQGTKTTQKDSTEEKYIFVDGSEGKQALLTTQKAPLIKGVVVVCEGGDDTTVRSRIIDAVTTALDIGSNRVCVTKMSNEK